MARICGICPVSHLIASSKACDQILAVEPPPTGADLRRVMNLAQIVQSNALSFFHLSSPDLLFGFDADPAKRNIIGVAQANPQLARDGVGVRRFGQQIIEWLGGKRIHPAWVVPGGVDAPLAEETRDRILSTIPEAIAAIERALAWYKSSLLQWEEEAAVVRRLPVGVHGPRRPGRQRRLLRRLAAGHGRRRPPPRRSDRSARLPGLPRRGGRAVVVPEVDLLEDARLSGRASTASARWPGSSSPRQMGTPRADIELDEFRRRLGRVPSSSFHYHYARLIDTLHARSGSRRSCAARTSSRRACARSPDINSNEGIGVSEAPRGTLIHHYRVDDDGIVQWANLVIATGHNNLAMNQSVRQVAKRYVKSAQLTEPMLNRVEAVIRCYDPCLSCSTHALGEMPLQLQLIGPDGTVLDEIKR